MGPQVDRIAGIVFGTLCFCSFANKLAMASISCYRKNDMGVLSSSVVWTFDRIYYKDPCMECRWVLPRFRFSCSTIVYNSHYYYYGSLFQLESFSI